MKTATPTPDTRRKAPSALPALLLSAALLAASCGDDSKGSGGGGEEGTVKTVADLGTCLSTFEGDTYRVEEMDGDYRCEGGKWVALSSLGECTDSLSRAGAVKKERNRGLDGYGTAYACRDSAWTPATEVEAALGNACAEGLDGELRKDSASKKGKTYACANGSWREATDAERAAGALCTKANENAFATDSSDRKNPKIYVCTDSLWREASAVEAATRSVCGKNLRGTFAADSSEKSLPLYVCDSADYGWTWRVASEAEGMTRLLCDGSVEGDTVSFHVCTSSGWARDTSSTLGACTEKRSGEVATEGNPFRVEGLNATASDSGYVCDGSSWRKATAGERATGKLCTEKVDGDTLNWYVCDASSNDWAAVMTTGLPACDASRLDSVATEPNPNLGRGDSLYACADTGSSEYAWKKLETSLLGTCGPGLQDSVRAEPNVNLATYGKEFVCDAGAWEDAANYDIENGVPCTENLGDVVVGSLLCGSDGKWRAATEEELDMGAACTESSEGTVSVEKGRTCRDGEWVAASAGEKATGFVCVENMASTTVTNGYVCEASSGTYAFREATSVEKATSRVCTEDIFLSYTAGYVCDTSSGAYGWRSETAAEKATGFVCVENMASTTVTNGYVCEASSGTYAFREATSVEKTTGYVCTEATQTNAVTNGYYCLYDSYNGGRFIEASEVEKTAGFRCTTDSLNVVSNGYVCYRYVYADDSDEGRDPIYRLGFRSANAGEIATGKICGQTAEWNSVWVTDTSSFGTAYICVTDSNWRKATKAEHNVGYGCVESKIGKEHSCFLHGSRFESSSGSAIGAICNAYTCTSSGFRKDTFACDSTKVSACMYHDHY